MTKRQKTLILASIRRKLDSETELEKIAADCGKPYILGKIREHLAVLSRCGGSYDYESIILWCILGIHESEVRRASN